MSITGPPLSYMEALGICSFVLICLILAWIIIHTLVIFISRYLQSRRIRHMQIASHERLHRIISRDFASTQKKRHT